MLDYSTECWLATGSGFQTKFARTTHFSPVFWKPEVVWSIDVNRFQRDSTSAGGVELMSVYWDVISRIISRYPTTFRMFICLVIKATASLYWPHDGLLQRISVHFQLCAVAEMRSRCKSSTKWVASYLTQSPSNARETAYEAAAMKNKCCLHRVPGSCRAKCVAAMTSSANGEER